MGHLLIEELVEGVEVNGVLSCSSGGKILFWIDHDVWVVTFIGKEWWHSGGSTWSIVVWELSEGQKFRPIVLLIDTVNLEVLLEVWFIRSVWPTPSGWCLEVKCNLVLRALPRERKKWEMNSKPMLVVIWEGTPCLENIWRRESFASSRNVIMS